MQLIVTPSTSSAQSAIGGTPVPAREEAIPLRRRWMGGLIAMRDTPFWQVLATAFLGSTAINLLFAILFRPEEQFGAGDLGDLALGISIGTSMWLSMGYLNAWLAKKVDWLGKPWQAFGLAVISNIIVGTLALGAVYFVTFVIIGGEKPLDWLLRQRIGWYYGSILIGLLITAIYQGAFFIGLWKQSLVETERLKSANLSAKYEALNAQINPHFLFNSLNVLSALVRRDASQAEEFIQGLSEVYRYVLEVRQEPLVALSREIKALRAYIHLVEMRFGAERLQVSIQLPRKPVGQVVPLALQMLVENAVKHNGATRKNPLRIEIGEEGGNLYVRNNRVPLFESADSSGLGLANIRERYQLAAGAEVVVEETEREFVVKLPVVDKT